ncbi:MAG: cyclodeaminase/cyclohydrolase family protein [Candidatus Omnitrophota bacterium]
MISYNHHTLDQYLDELSQRQPVPGGGSAAAISGALGAALIAMSARYGLGKGKSEPVEQKINDIIAIADKARLQFLFLAGRDAEAYQKVLQTRKAADKVAHNKALAEAAAVPCDIMYLCENCLLLTPYLFQEGNPFLFSDVKAAEAFLRSAIDVARIMQEVNT